MMVEIQNMAPKQVKEIQVVSSCISSNHNFEGNFLLSMSETTADNKIIGLYFCDEIPMSGI